MPIFLEHLERGARFGLVEEPVADGAIGGQDMLAVAGGWRDPALCQQA
jgi:hypothetical protein